MLLVVVNASMDRHSEHGPIIWSASLGQPEHGPIILNTSLGHSEHGLHYFERKPPSFWTWFRI